MLQVDRRRFLGGAAALAGGTALTGGPFAGYLARAAGQTGGSQPPLGPVPDLADGVTVRLHLPPGFQYRSFHDTATAPVLDDGTVLPARHDGMAAFSAGRGKVWLVRNHEVNGPGPAFGPGSPYDAQARGGTTTTLVDRFGNVQRAFTSLNGSQMNCAGGPMPWGSWVTCEETVNGPDVGPDFTGVSNVPLTKPHGFIFEVPAGGQSDREPIESAGRFPHEAVAYDPHDDILYLTEDNFGFPSGLYRYKARRRGSEHGGGHRLRDGGRLQMLAVVGRPNAHLEASQPVGSRYRVRWVDIDDPAPSFPYTPGQTASTTNDQALTYVGNQGRAQGAAYFSRLEGAYFANGLLWFTATQGGGPAEASTGPIADGFGNGSGQIWAYHPRSDMLRLAYESPGPDTLDLPDNVTVRGRRGALVICEDGGNDNYLRVLTRGGRLFNIALNRLAGQFNDEFAGATFSPDGHTLYVNIQASRAITFAIWGPWDRLGI
jgi:secreted PhoX family phosphatase